MRSSIPYAVLIAVVLVVPAVAEETRDQATPLAVFLASEEIQQGPREKIMPQMIPYIEPQEIEKFKAAFIAELKKGKPDASADEKAWADKINRPYTTVEKASAATGEEILVGVSDNMRTYLDASLPAEVTSMKWPKAKVHKTIMDGDDKAFILVTYPSLGNEPSLIEMIRRDNKWYGILPALYALQVRGYEFQQKVKDSDWKEGDPFFVVERVRVVDQVKLSESEVVIVARVDSKIQNVKVSRLMTHVIKESDEAWKHLGDKNRAKLEEVLTGVFQDRDVFDFI